MWSVWESRTSGREEFYSPKPRGLAVPLLHVGPQQQQVFTLLSHTHGHHTAGRDIFDIAAVPIGIESSPDPSASTPSVLLSSKPSETHLLCIPIDNILDPGCKGGLGAEVPSIFELPSRSPPSAAEGDENFDPRKFIKVGRLPLGDPAKLLLLLITSSPVTPNGTWTGGPGGGRCVG